MKPHVPTRDVRFESVSACVRQQWDKLSGIIKNILKKLGRAGREGGVLEMKVGEIEVRKRERVGWRGRGYGGARNRRVLEVAEEEEYKERVRPVRRQG